MSEKDRQYMHKINRLEGERDALSFEVVRLRTDLAGFEAGAEEEANAGDEARAEVKQLREVCRAAHGAVLKTVMSEDVLDGDEGLVVVQKLQEAIVNLKTEGLVKTAKIVEHYFVFKIMTINRECGGYGKLEYNPHVLVAVVGAQFKSFDQAKAYVHRELMEEEGVDGNFVIMREYSREN